MQETTNLHLKKYELTDIADLTATNPNWDTLDTSISGHVGATTGVHSIGTGYYVAKTSNSNQLPNWDDIQNKPSSITPSAHAYTHKTGGSDPLSPSDIGAATTATYSTTLSASSWSGDSAPYSQSKTVTGILATDSPIVDIVMSGTYSTDIARIDAWGGVYRIVTASNQITAYATEKPTVDLPISIKVVR